MVAECGHQLRNITPGEMNLIFRARLIWRNLATWMLIYLASLFGNYGNQQEIRDQIYTLPEDYVNVIKMVFGEKVAEHYSTLLTVYVANLVTFYESMRNGNQNEIDAHIRSLRDSIDQRAAFLAQINPYWQEGTWRMLLHGANNMLIEMAITYMQKEYKKNIDVYSRLLDHTNIIGDYFSQGIMNYLILDDDSVRPGMHPIDRVAVDPQ
jgi:hypothetical protein